MFRKLLLAILIAASVSSCKSLSTYKDSPVIACNLIDACVKETLKFDTGLHSNDHHFLVDFSAKTNLHSTGVYQFLKLNMLATETNLDSLFHNDKQWQTQQYFEHPVIRIEKIEELKNGDILVVVSKTKSAEGAIGTEIILHLNGDQFTVVKSRITWAS